MVPAQAAGFFLLFLLNVDVEGVCSLVLLRAFLIDLLLVPENSDTKFSGSVLRASKTLLARSCIARAYIYIYVCIISVELVYLILF